MDHPSTLLVVWHSRTGASEQMAQAAGKHAAARIVSAERVTAADMLGAGGYLFVCPENLGALSGAMKEMFDTMYYPCLGKVDGRAYASVIAAGSDGEGAQRQLDRIVTGWRLKRVAEPMIVNFKAQTPDEILARKSVSDTTLRDCEEMGAAMAEGLELGLF